MESPRSSMFSTLIMTLPLVVVPAIALLRPPAPNSGVSANALDASEDDDFFSELDVFEESYTGDATDASAMTRTEPQDEIDQLFAEEPGTQAESAVSSAPPFGADDPFLSNSPQAGSTAQPASSNANLAPGARPPGRNVERTAAGNDVVDERTLLNQLSRLGVRRIMWFRPGVDSQVGFAAFVPARDPTMTYRFEAVADGRAGALKDVLQQLSAWRKAIQDSRAAAQ